MKIEAGKYYRTRDGRKAFVSAVLLPNPFAGPGHMYPAIGYVESASTVWWTKDGRYSCKESHHPFDLISEWREPETVSVWVYSFRCFDGALAWHCSSSEPAIVGVLDKKLVTLGDGTDGKNR